MADKKSKLVVAKSSELSQPIDDVHKQFLMWLH